MVSCVKHAAPPSLPLVRIRQRNYRNTEVEASGQVPRELHRAGGTRSPPHRATQWDASHIPLLKRTSPIAGESGPGGKVLGGHTPTGPLRLATPGALFALWSVVVVALELFSVKLGFPSPFLLLGPG